MANIKIVPAADQSLGNYLRRALSKSKHSAWSAEKSGWEVAIALLLISYSGRSCWTNGKQMKTKQALGYFSTQNRSIRKLDHALLIYLLLKVWFLFPFLCMYRFCFTVWKNVHLISLLYYALLHFLYRIVIILFITLLYILIKKRKLYIASNQETEYIYIYINIYIYIYIYIGGRESVLW